MKTLISLGMVDLSKGFILNAEHVFGITGIGGFAEIVAASNQPNTVHDYRFVVGYSLHVIHLSFDSGLCKAMNLGIWCFDLTSIKEDFDVNATIVCLN